MGGVSRWIRTLVLRVWVASKWAEVSRLPRPSDAAEAHVAGVERDRVLIFGGGPAVGWGVLSHELALPGALSRALSRRTGRGADVYLVATPRLKVGKALDPLTRLTLRGYDAVVITLGVNDAGALTPLSLWERDLSAVLRIICGQTSPDSRVFVAGLHPIRSIPLYDHPLGSIAESHAQKMNGISAQVCRGVPRVNYVPLSAPAASDSVRFRDARSYRHWAEELAGYMAPQLSGRGSLADFRRNVGNTHDSGYPRTVATTVESLDGLPDGHDWRVQHVVALACTVFGVRSATVSFIDTDRLVHAAQIGDVPKTVMLGESFTATVIREPGGMIVPDATVDARFRNLPHVFGTPRIRFYAGFAIESRDGTRVGTLNLFDPAPRFSDEAWRMLRLRDFGTMLQSELRATRA